MSKKFSIAKSIDVEKLSQELDRYRESTNEIDPYIFMNMDTLETIAMDVIPVKAMIETLIKKYRALNNISGVAGRYEGYKVFIDDELKFGEIEIR